MGQPLGCRLVARLTELGVTSAPAGPGTALADPEGNEFCVLAPA